MNTRLLFIGAFVLVAIAVVIVFLPSNKIAENSMSGSNDQTQIDDTSIDSTVIQDASNPNSLKYIEYSPSSFDTNQSSRRILFFYASWCPTCRPADASFKENEAQLPEDVVVIRVNYNDPDTDTDEKALAQKYGITYQHTFVQIDSEGNEVTRWNGGEIEEVMENIE